MRRLSVLVLVALFISATSLHRVQAAAGDLDTTFGTGGKVFTPFNEISAFASSVVIQPDGKIVVAGIAELDFGVARYNADGILDTTFGTNGVVLTSFGGQDGASDLALQADGKIVVVGLAVTDKLQYGVARYNTNGSPDTTFGVGGKVTTSFGLDDQAFAVVIQPNGKILVAGTSLTPTSRDFSLARYNTDGNLDNTFGNGGMVTTDFFGNLDEALDVALQSDGKIVAAGLARRQQITPPFVRNDDFAVVRYNSDGSIDPTFGKVSTDFFNGNDTAFAVAIQTDGKIVLAGEAEEPSLDNSALVRYNGNGSLDTTFGAGGKVTTDVGGAINDIVIQPNGKIIAAGGSFDFITNTNFALVRYNSNGSLDPSFGSGGKTSLDFFGDQDLATALAIQADGKIVTAGFATLRNPFAVNAFALARFEGDDPGFDICLQSGSDVLRINSESGAYEFTNCNGLTIGGTGTLRVRGCTLTLQHNAPDRRVMAMVDTCRRRGTATVQTFSPRRTANIADLDTTDSCGCR